MHSRYRKNTRWVIVAMLKEVGTKEVPMVDMGALEIEYMAEGEVGPRLVSIVDKSVMYQGFVPNRTCFVHTTIVLSMSSKTILSC
jgi:hypothetical protein